MISGNLDNKKKSTILLVEDEVELLALMKTLLNEEGFIVLTATDGLEAVEIFRQQFREIDLVLSDMGLSRMGGWDAFEQMKKIYPGVRMIFASAFVNPELIIAAKKNGVIDFVEKPYDIELLFSKIKETLR